MARVGKIKGVKKLLVQFKNKKVKNAKGIEQGLKLAGMHLFNKSQELVPIFRGNLRASGTVRSIGSGFKTEVIVGYGTDYAIYVHENLGESSKSTFAAHGKTFNQKYSKEIADPPKWVNLWGEKVKGSLYYFKRGVKQQAKFLETPVRMESITMQKIIRTAIKLAGS